MTEHVGIKALGEQARCELCLLGKKFQIDGVSLQKIHSEVVGI